jgi:hypothetical protein
VHALINTYHSPPFNLNVTRIEAFAVQRGALPPDPPAPKDFNEQGYKALRTARR